MKKENILIILLLYLNATNITICANLLYAKQPAKIQGRILSHNMKEPLAGANIILLGTKRGAASDTNGYFIINDISPGEYSLQADMIGYESRTHNNITLKDSEIKTINFTLPIKPLQLGSITVKAKRLSEKYQSEVSLVGVRRMQPKQILSIPGALDDPTRAVLIYSGVSSTGDFNSYFSVRGGSPHQNIVVMDDMVVPNPYRLRLMMGGGLSIFNPNTTKDIHLHLGGFTAEYGNCLSSVLEVTTRTGNDEQFSCRSAINLTDASGMVEGPLLKGKIRYLLAARRTYFDFLADQLTKGNSTYPYNYEIFNKWIIDVAERNKITLTYMLNKEGTKLISDLSESVNLTEDADMNFTILSWTYQHKKCQIKTILSYYQDSMGYHVYNPKATQKNIDYEFLDSKTNNCAFKENINYQLAKNSQITLGLQGSLIDTDIFFQNIDRNFYYARNDFPNEIIFDNKYQNYAIYLQNSTKINDHLQLQFGGRYDHSTLIKEGQLSPRFSFWYKLNGQTTIEGSWGVCYQFPDPATVYTRDQPLNFGPATDFLTSEKATQNAISIERDITHSVSAKCEFYYNNIDRILLPIDEELYIPRNNGFGVSQGIEFSMEMKPSYLSRINGLVSYSYGNSKYRRLDSDKWIPFNNDRRHAITILGNYKLHKNWQISLLWRVASGLPYTDIPGVLIRYNYDWFYWNYFKGQRNAARFSSYQRLDCRISYRYQVGSKFFSIYLDLINLYNHKNVYNITWEKVIPDQSTSDIKAIKKRIIYMMPFFPSLGLSYQL